VLSRLLQLRGQAETPVIIGPAGTFDGEVKKKLIALSLWWRERADEEESTPRANFLI
jgi:hypothetical protein